MKKAYTLGARSSEYSPRLGCLILRNGTVEKKKKKKKKNNNKKQKQKQKTMEP